MLPLVVLAVQAPVQHPSHYYDRAGCVNPSSCHDLRPNRRSWSRRGAVSLIHRQLIIIAGLSI